jgi:hypothetical protein
MKIDKSALIVLTTSLALLTFGTQKRCSEPESRFTGQRLVEVVDLSTVATGRRLPPRVAPAPGEPIDSWLEATAHWMDLPLGAIARALDLPIATRPAWIRWLSRDQLEAIEAATGVSSSAVKAMTLGVYDGTALQLDPDSHRLDATFPFGALSWSRFCPECIRESDGRWRLEWRLGWSFACVLHRCLLADACPSCGKYQRRLQVYRRVPAPTLCVCGYRLGETQTVKLPADHVIVDAQQQVFDVVNHCDTSFGVFEGNRRGSPPETDDLLLLQFRDAVLADSDLAAGRGGAIVNL